MKRTRIVPIGNIDLLVTNGDYESYWNAYRCGRNSADFYIKCRRLLGLGPTDHIFIPDNIKLYVWGSMDITEWQIQSIKRFIDYIEPPLLESKNLSYEEFVKLLDSINEHDDEFEPDLEI